MTLGSLTSLIILFSHWNFGLVTLAKWQHFLKHPGTVSSVLMFQFLLIRSSYTSTHLAMGVSPACNQTLKSLWNSFGCFCGAQHPSADPLFVLISLQAPSSSSLLWELFQLKVSSSTARFLSVGIGGWPEPAWAGVMNLLCQWLLGITLATK